MRSNRARVLALVLVAFLSFPVLPVELFGGDDSAAAQSGGVLAGLLPPGVAWQDWQAPHKLYIHHTFNAAGDEVGCAAPEGIVTFHGDRQCQLPMNVTEVPAQLSRRITKTLTTDDAIQNDEGQQVYLADPEVAYMRLEPGLAHGMRVNSLSALVYVSVTGLTACSGSLQGGGLPLEQSGRLTVYFEVRMLPAGDQGTGQNPSGEVLGSRTFDTCPRDTSSCVICPLASDIPLRNPNLPPLESGVKLQFRVAVAREAPGTWTMEYDGNGAASYLQIGSPDAFQFATWLEDRDRKVTTVFPMPPGPGDRLSAVGFFGFKSAFGGYDNPAANSSTPQTTDAKWRMQVRAPDGALVSLRDPAVQQNPEFKDCEGDFNDFITCLDQGPVSTDSPPSAKVFRMPSRPVAPGSGPVWNYTIDRLNQIAPGGGEFKLEVFGRVRGNAIESRLADGVRFTVGGFGVRLAPFRAGLQEETLSHTVVAGQSTTFLLNITNSGPRADNFTLSNEFLTCSPNPCQGWNVAFSGRDVRGADTVSLPGFNSSILKVTVTPPAGALGAGLKVSARSITSPDQRNETQLNVQVSSTVNRGVGLFVGPEPAEKLVRRGHSAIFNYTIWNRGTDLDSFSVNCEQGPDHSVRPDGTRVDDTWNGTIRVGGTTIGCRDLNATRTLTVTIPPGDVREAVVQVEASPNATSKPQLNVGVKAESQRESGKVARFTATANLETVRSFKMFILTDGQANPEDPQSPVQASRVMRFGKDDPLTCPSPANPSAPNGVDCNGSEDEEMNLIQDWDSQENGSNLGVTSQRLDLDFSEFAFYRVTIVNDGDEEGVFNLRIAEVRNSTIANQAQLEDGCGAGMDSFTHVSRTSQNNNYAMNDQNGLLLLNRPVYYWPVVDTDVINVLRVPAGQSGVFYLRVHHEWNRVNLSEANGGLGNIGGGGLVNPEGGPVCDSESRVTVQATATNYPIQTVVAVTQALNADEQSPRFTKAALVTQGARNDQTNLYDAEFAQPCPPVTAPGSGDRVFCKYIKPGQVLEGCGCSVSWFFTGTKFWGAGDEMSLKPLRRVGGFSLTDLVNRGWRFSGPILQDENLGRNPNAKAVGDEVKFRVDVTVPGNATVSDFAGLQVQVGTNRSGDAPPFAFYTVGAQKFKVNATNLAGIAPIQVHPGDRAAININVSNEGAAVDVFNITAEFQGNFPGYSFSFQPNETRVSPSRNKTVTVFVHTPPQLQPLPQLVSGNVRVNSIVNQTQFRDERTGESTFAVADFRVQVMPFIADNVQLVNTGLETRNIGNAGSVTFALNISNPAPTQKTFVLRRLPAADTVRQFVDGWTDFVGEPCFEVAARSTKPVSFTVTAPLDALEGTHVTWVLRADEANTQCVPLAQSPNFAQALVTTTVIGRVGLEVQPVTPVQVVPRGGSVSFPVLLRNVGTAGDNFVFRTRFVNESQGLPPDPWTVRTEVIPTPQTPANCPQRAAAVQSIFVDPQLGCIVHVTLTAPLNIATLGVRSDVEFSVQGTEGSPASVRLTAFVQDYDIRVRITNSTVDAAPGQTLFFVLNITNAGNGHDTHDIFVDIGGLRGYWNVTSQFAFVGLLNGTSKDVLITVQVPRDPLPTTGAVIGITVRSQQVEAMRPAAEALGAGSPLVAYLNTVPKSALLSVNLFPYVNFDVDGDKSPEIAVDRNRNNRDGYEAFQDPFTQTVQAVSLLTADGDGDGRMDHWVDIDLDGRPERYWDPDDIRITAIGGSVGGAAGSANEAYPDVNNDGTLEFLYDSDGDLAIDSWIDPATRRIGRVIERDFDDDGNAEWIIDTNDDQRPDKYFDADRGPRGLVTNVEAAPGGNPQQYAIDTTGQGRPTKVYDTVTGEVTTASFSSVGAFFADFWYLILLFIAVAVLAGYLVYNQRRAKPPQ